MLSFITNVTIFLILPRLPVLRCPGWHTPGPGATYDIEVNHMTSIGCVEDPLVLYIA